MAHPYTNGAKWVSFLFYFGIFVLSVFCLIIFSFWFCKGFLRERERERDHKVGWDREGEEGVGGV